jgi:hypothetical protein
MPSLCILCNHNPPIENSHIVPNFVIKRLKAGNPLQTLVHSNALNKTFQDGWKGNYLCKTCEGKFSKLEGWFCGTIYDPYLAGTAIKVNYTEQLGLFAASLAFRYLRFGFEQNPSKPVPPRLRELDEDLRAALDSGSLSNLRANSYLQFLAPVTSIKTFPPGINTYLFEAIDGSAFPWCIPPTEEYWVVYVKLPGMFFLTSLLDLDRIRVPGGLAGHQIQPAGILESKVQSGNLSVLVSDTFREKALEIQADYERMPASRLKRNMEKISKTPNKEQSRAHQTYLLDARLLSELRAGKNP